MLNHILPSSNDLSQLQKKVRKSAPNMLGMNSLRGLINLCIIYMENFNNPPNRFYIKFL